MSKTPSIKAKLEKISYWPEIKRIIHKIHQNGWTALIVGGAVRQALLNKKIGDVDLTSSAKPDQLLKLFPKAKGIFKNYGVVVIPLKNKQNIEITSFRKDSKSSDGRRPQFIEYSGIEEDSKRRDFTINALFYELKTDQIIDKVGGIKDLKNKTIKCIGKAEDRFKEDHLRILRALRLAHQLNFKIEAQTQLALTTQRHTIKKLAKERILAELNKMFKVGRWDLSLQLLKQKGLWEILFPSLDFSASTALSSEKDEALSSARKKTLGSSQDKTLGSARDKTLGSSQDKALSSAKDKTLGSVKDKALSSAKNKTLSSVKDREQKILLFYRQNFSGYHEEAFCWTALALPFFYNNKKNFQAFLNTYPLSSAVRKQAVSYWFSVQTLIQADSLFADKLIAFNNKAQAVYELTKALIESKILYNPENPLSPKTATTHPQNEKPQSKTATLDSHRHSRESGNLDLTQLNFYFKEFKKRATNDRLAPALITGYDLLNFKKALKTSHFSKYLKQAYRLQIENPSWSKSRILKNLVL